MNITFSKENNKLVVVPEGKIDTITAPEFENIIQENIEGVDDITIDFNLVEYISSAGLRVLLALQKIMNKKGAMKLINVCDEVMEVFEITGFIDILDVE